MSAEIEQPRLKECISCHKDKPHTEAFFELRRYRDARGWEVKSWRGQCRDCRRKRVKATRLLTKANTPPRTVAPGYGNKRAEVYIPGPKPCVACHDMPWRVAGPRCPNPKCGLEYAPEARPEMVLRRFDRCG